jgi:hypothetical protein
MENMRSVIKGIFCVCVRVCMREGVAMQGYSQNVCYPEQEFRENVSILLSVILHVTSL